MFGCIYLYNTLIDFFFIFYLYNSGCNNVTCIATCRLPTAGLGTKGTIPGHEEEPARSARTNSSTIPRCILHYIIKRK